MSDLLSGLRVLSDEAGTPGRIYNSALADAQWRLRNPTDEQVDAIAGRARRTLGTWVTGYEVRAVLAAAAGGDQ